MPFIQTPIDGLIVFEPKIWGDDRGYFYESYNQKTFEAGGVKAVFVQDNESSSSFGVLRGLHYQIGEFAQAKLVRVSKGKVLDIAVDIRPGSPTYGKWHGEILSEENKKQMFVPRGFAHGFAVLSDQAVFCYKCDNFYSKESEGGVAYNDPNLNIDWQLDPKEMVLSDKDKIHPILGEHRAYIPSNSI